MAAAKEAWGQRQLSELEAEERLAMACEKAPTSDHATSKLRAAFRVLLSPFILCPGKCLQRPWPRLAGTSYCCSEVHSA